MLGAIIGDMSAWTSVHHPECFQQRLVSHDAKLSGYGYLAFTMFEPITDCGLINKNRMYVRIGKALMHQPPCVIMPEEWHIWGMCDYDKPIPFNLKIAMISAAIIDSGLCSEKRQNQFNWSSFFHGGKQEYYASFLMTAIRRLREGKTKDEALQDLPKFAFDFYVRGYKHGWKNFLDYTTFAWRCAYYAKDFKSALLNAAKCTGNRHLAMFLTGAIAEAMYGIDAYGGDIPREIEDCFGLKIRSMRRVAKLLS